MDRIVHDFNTTKPAGYYLHDERLGRGAQGAVYAGQKQGEERPYAIKIITGQELDEAERQRFQSEAQLMHGLGAHPNIAAVHFAGEFTTRLSRRERSVGLVPQHYLFAVMDRAPGSVKDEIIRAEATPLGRLATALGAQYILDIIAGVGHAHGEAPDGRRRPGVQGIIHRDIKPANALLFPGPGPERPTVVKICDFGIARLGYDRPEDVTQTHFPAGTLAYAHPSQFEHGGATFKNEQYTVAATGLHIITGRLPFEQTGPLELMDAHRHLPVPHRELLTPDRRVDHVAEQIQATLTVGMHKDPEARHPSMAAMGDAVLEAVMRGWATQQRHATVHNMPQTLLGWNWRVPKPASAHDTAQSPLGAQPTAPVTPPETPRRGISDETLRRRVILGTMLAAAGAVGVPGTIWALGIGKQPGTPEATPTASLDQKLSAILNQPAPSTPELSDAEKAAAWSTASAIAKEIIDFLEPNRRMDDLLHLLESLAPYDPSTAYQQAVWMDSHEQDTLSGSDAKRSAWTMATLAAYKADQVATFVAQNWSDTGAKLGVFSKLNDRFAANRGVVGAALADQRPDYTRIMTGQYTGSNAIALAYNKVLTLAVAPTSAQASSTFRGLQLEHKAALAPVLAQQNPDLIKNDITNSLQSWAAQPALLLRSLLALLPDSPSFVRDTLGSSTLGKAKGGSEAILHIALQCAATRPDITAEVMKRHLSSISLDTKMYFAISLARYQPALAQTMLSALPSSELLQAALHPTDAGLRAKAATSLKNTLQHTPTTILSPSQLGIAFVGAFSRK